MKGKRFLSLALCGVLCLSVSGCFGGFNLTQKTYNFNAECSENQWIQELAFIGLGVVYGLTLFADALVLNSIEFWTGENPVSLDDDGGEEDDDEDDDEPEDDGS